jgi:hypothetical protein
LARTLALAGLLGAAGLAHADAVTAPEVPEAIRAPGALHAVFKARASGAQVYVCSLSDAGKAQWTLKAPDAQLRDDQGALIGHHGAGPSWRLKDGSEITGKAAAKSDSPDPASIPWLLVAVTAHRGEGALSAVTHVQRVNTEGGQPPPAATCDPKRQQGKEARVPYRALYYFYAPAGP